RLLEQRLQGFRVEWVSAVNLMADHEAFGGVTKGDLVSELSRLLGFASTNRPSVEIAQGDHPIRDHHITLQSTRGLCHHPLDAVDLQLQPSARRPGTTMPPPGLPLRVREHPAGLFQGSVGQIAKGARVSDRFLLGTLPTQAER